MKSMVNELQKVKLFTDLWQGIHRETMKNCGKNIFPVGKNSSSRFFHWKIWL